MKLGTTLLSIACCALIAGCAPGKSVGDRPLTNAYEGKTINWRSGAKTFIFYRAVENEGKVAICGAYSFDKPLYGGTESLHQRALNAMSFYLDGERLQNGLGYFKVVPLSVLDQGGGSASCVVTEKPWKDEYASSVKPELRASKTGFKYYQ